MFAPSPCVCQLREVYERNGDNAHIDDSQEIVTPKPVSRDLPICIAECAFTRRNE